MDLLQNAPLISFSIPHISYFETNTSLYFKRNIELIYVCMCVHVYNAH